MTTPQSPDGDNSPDKGSSTLRKRRPPLVRGGGPWYARGAGVKGTVSVKTKTEKSTGKKASALDREGNER